MKAARTILLHGLPLPEALNRICKKHRICGASLAILKDGTIHTAASGWANAPERIEATPSTLFQIGSISKTFTATLAMQLVDEGLLDLDAPIRRYLPDFATADPVARDVSVRALLTHTSGMEGDYFIPDDGGSEVYVGKLTGLEQLHAPGEYMTYCNSGYVVLTRIIEVLRNGSWNDLVVDRICKPLGLTHFIAQPKDSLRFRMATGHVLDGKGAWTLAPEHYMSLSMAGAGTVLSMSASDLVRYAQVHMTGPSRRTTKKSILSRAGFRAMQTAEVKMPPHSRPVHTHMGLSWFLDPDEKAPKLNHDGGTTQLSFLHILPKQRVIVALLINCINTTIGEAVRKAVFKEIAGLEPELKRAVPPAQKIDSSRYTGMYRNLEQTVTVTASKPGHLRVSTKVHGQTKSSKLLLRAAELDEFVIMDKPHEGRGARVVFLGDVDGRAQYFRLSVRMSRRSEP